MIKMIDDKKTRKNILGSIFLIALTLFILNKFESFQWIGTFFSSPQVIIVLSIVSLVLFIVIRHYFFKKFKKSVMDAKTIFKEVLKNPPSSVNMGNNKLK